MTQKQLADQMHLSDKTISKWERGLGCPDIALLTELSALLKIDTKDLLSGECTENTIVGGNMKNTAYYVCPICGNLTFCTGKAKVSCCGRPLTSLKAKPAADGEKLHITEVEDEWYIESTHPAARENYISFLAFVTGDQLHILKQYPEWEIQVRLPKRRHGKLLWYSTTKGLYYQYL